MHLFALKLFPEQVPTLQAQKRIDKLIKAFIFRHFKPVFQKDFGRNQMQHFPIITLLSFSLNN